MKASFNFGGAINYTSFQLKDFLGVDFANDPSEVNAKRSPDAINMVSNIGGMVEKRTGYSVQHTFIDLAHPLIPQKINCIYVGKYMQGAVEKDVLIVHAGTSLYSYGFFDGQDKVWGRLSIFRPDKMTDYYPDTIEDTPSHIIPFKDNKLLFFGAGAIFMIMLTPAGSEPYQYDTEGFVISSITHEYLIDFLDQPQYGFNEVFIPLTNFARTPTGGGTVYDEINMLSRWRKNSFLGTAGATVYQLDATGLDTPVYTNKYAQTLTSYEAGEVYVQKLNADGSYTELVEQNDHNIVGDFFTNASTGTITFKVAPGVSPVSGRDNIIITFAKRNTINEDRLKMCYPYTLYGQNGRNDYLFLAGKWLGNNYDYRGRISDLFFGELGYTTFGTTKQTIMGYSRIGNNVAVHQTVSGSNPTIFIRSVTLDANNVVVFPIAFGVAGVGILSQRSFGSLRDDPLFLSEGGITSLASNDITGVRYAQDRGYYINQKLLAEPNLEDSVAVVYDNKYMIAVNGNVYVADVRKRYNEKNSPGESYQYEWYFWNNINVTAFGESKNHESFGSHLLFGNDEGQLCMMKNKTDNFPYQDDEVATIAEWNTPVLYFDNITAKKTLKNLWVKIATYERTGAEIYYRTAGLVRTASVDLVVAGVNNAELATMSNNDLMNFFDIDFTRFTFNTDSNPQVIVTNKVQRQFMSIQFKIRNANAEPFGLLEMVAKYKLNSTYKGG